jgi:hypothetical protein
MARSIRATTIWVPFSLPVNDNGSPSDAMAGPTAVGIEPKPEVIVGVSGNAVAVGATVPPLPFADVPDPAEGTVEETPAPLVLVPVEPEAVELGPLELDAVATVELPVDPVPAAGVPPAPVAPVPVPVDGNPAKVKTTVEVVVDVGATVVEVAVAAVVVVAAGRVVVAAGAIVVVVLAGIWTTAGAPGSVTIPAVGFESPRPLSRIVMVMMLPTNCVPVSPSNVNACHAPPTTL